MRDAGSLSAPGQRCASKPASQLPLVSLMILTCNRHAFLRLALSSAAAQDYAKIEAVVVDDGEQAVPRASLSGYRMPVRLVRVPSRSTIGEKRNLACRAARGRVLVHWDDDDLHPPNQVSSLACPILRNETDISALALSYFGRLRSTDAAFFRFGGKNPGATIQPFLGSLAYSRAVASSLTSQLRASKCAVKPRAVPPNKRADGRVEAALAPFADVSLSEDLHFVERGLSACLRMLTITDVHLVYTRHRAIANTWRAEFFKSNTSKYSVVDDAAAVAPPSYVDAAMRRAYTAAEADAKTRGACTAPRRHAPGDIVHPLRYPYMPEKCCRRDAKRQVLQSYRRPCPGGGSACGDTFCGPTKGLCTARCTCAGEPTHGQPGAAACGLLCCRYWHDWWPRHLANCSMASARPLKAHYCGGQQPRRHASRRHAMNANGTRSPGSSY